MTGMGEGDRTAAVLARLTAADVRLAVDALSVRTQQDLARRLHVPVSTLTRSGVAVDVVRRRARAMPPVARSEFARGLAEACVTETIVALGDHFLEPSYEDLGSALDERCERWGVRIVALMLAATADDDFPAREVCARLFDEDPRFALDALGPVQEDHAPKPVARHTPTPNEADAEAKREARRERRRAQKGQARPARVAHPTYRRATRDSSSAPEPEGGADTAAFAATRPSRTEMRAVLVVGTYDDVRYDDPLVGAVVDAFIPFGDPDDERGAGKTRPCVVLAACADDRLVVRPCYSGGGLRSGDWKSVRVGDAQAAGLDRESYVSTEEFAVRRAPAARAVRGWLSREDWNAL